MGSSQHHRRGSPSLMRLKPPRRAKAPTTPRLQPRKTSAGSRKIIAARAAEFQKLSRHPRANHMNAKVVLARLAIAIAIETSHRIAIANLQWQSKHIHRPNMMPIGVSIIAAILTPHTSPNNHKAECNSYLPRRQPWPESALPIHSSLIS